MSVAVSTVPTHFKELASDQEVRWCPGCGDYGILRSVQTTFAELGRPREEIAVISGIGCSSRFPYYMNTFGFHTVHGRAPAFATGLKVSRPELSVWVITGDGDSFSIGTNHLLHAIRRNLDINILLFNNQIYGLTKGQYSPTSERGKVTKSSPMGSVDQPFHPLDLVLGAGASFVARSVDVQAKHLQATLKAAYEHRGTSFVEILQNCHIFNDGVWADRTDKKVRDEQQLLLEEGQPMTFGKEHDKGLSIDDFRASVVGAGEARVHDSTDLTAAKVLAGLTDPGLPLPLGVFYREERPVYEDEVVAQVEAARQKKAPDLQELLLQGAIQKS